MFTQFRIRYPLGSLLTELSAIDHGKYIVRCLVQVEGTTLVTSLAAAETVELAEDKARSRALDILGISPTTATGEQETPVVTSEIPVPLASTPNTSTGFFETPSVATTTLSESLGHSQSTQVPETVISNDTSRLSFSEPRYEEFTDSVPTTPLVAEEIPFTDEEFSADEIETAEDMETPLWEAEKMSSVQLDDSPAPSSSPKKPKKDTSKPPASDKPIDFSDIIARTNVELKRLGWTNQQGREYLVQTYGKRSRQLLSDAELLDFLHHLESEPAPE
jgi:hypothetical protein